MNALSDAGLPGRMAALVQEWRDAGDGRAAFLDCYARMTSNMLVATSRGEFNDAGWVTKLLHRFAGYYFDALALYERSSEDVPAVWRMAHDVARSGQGLVLQHMLLGINAHINYDLVLTLVEMLEGEWAALNPDRRLLRYADHCHVNDVIARTVDGVQDEVVERYTPLFDLVDRILGPVDEKVMSHMLVRWREEVWQHAMAVIASSDAATRANLLKNVEAITLERANALLLDDFSGLIKHLT